MRWTTILLFFLLASFFTSFAACGKEADTVMHEIPAPDTSTSNDTTLRKMKVTIGSTVFRATLVSNASSRAFQSLLPLTVNMTELNGNEKYFDLPNNLPVNAVNPRTIQTGDILLWGNNTLVLFYKSFATSYSYTRLGSIDDPKGLAAAVGAGNVRVTFELE